MKRTDSPVTNNYTHKSRYIGSTSNLIGGSVNNSLAYVKGVDFNS